MTNKNLDTFVRFGGLSSVRQKGYDRSMPTFHSPPARRGIYAFPRGCIETFLLGKQWFDPRRQQWIKDKHGNRIKSESELGYEKYPWSFCARDAKAKREYDKLISKYDDEEHVPTEELSALWGKHPLYVCRLANEKVFKYTGNLWHHLKTKPSEVLERKGDWVLSTHGNFQQALRRRMALEMAVKQSRGIGYSGDDLEVFIEKV